MRINFMQLNKNGLIDPSLKGENYWMCYFFLFFFLFLIFQVQGRFACPDRCMEIGNGGGTGGAPLVRGAEEPSGNNKDPRTLFFG